MRASRRALDRDITHPVVDLLDLPLADRVQRCVSRNRVLRGVERAKALFGLHPPFDRAMVLLQEVIQVLDRAMAAALAQGFFRLHARNRRAVKAGLIGINDAGLRMRRVAERPAEQSGLQHHRARPTAGNHGGASGVSGPVEVTPMALDSNIGLIDPPGFVGRFEMAAQPLFQFPTVTRYHRQTVV